MSAYRVSLANRRMILIAVLSLIASLLTINFNAPSVDAGPGDGVALDLSGSATADETGTVVITATVTGSGGGALAALVEVDLVALGTSTADLTDDYTMSDTKFSWPAATPSGTQDSITITIVPDDLDEGASEVINFQLQNPTLGTGLGQSTYDLTITDDDASGIDISPTTIGATEGGTDTYSVELLSEPVGTVTITVADDAQLSNNSGGSLTFDSGTWDTPQDVTVTADDDDVVEGAHTGTITHSASAPSDPNYDLGPITSVTMNITDNDTAGIDISPTTIGATEGGTDTYSVELLSEPVGTVTITVADDAQLSNNSGGSLTFDSGTWDTPQDVTVTADDDDVVEGAHTGTITHSASAPSDPNYDLGPITSVTMNITDNDTATVAFVGGATNAPEGTTPHQLTVQLSVSGGGSIESAVTVDINEVGGSAGGSDYTLTDTSVTFGPGSNHGAVRTVNIAIAPDTTHETNETIDLSVSVASGLATPSGQTTHTVTILDDDNVTVAFTLPSSNPTEDAPGSPPTITVTNLDVGGVLHDDVTVTFGTSGSASVGTDFTLTSPFTISAGTISGPIPVPLTIATDINHEADETIVMTMALSSGPANVSASPHTVTIDDDDDVTVSFTLPTSSVAEDKTPATHEPTITIVVPGTSTALAAPVVLAITATGASTATGGGVDYTLTTTTVTIPATTLEGPNSKVTLTLNDDLIVEDPDEIVVLSMSLTSGPAIIGTQATHAATIIDNESPGIVITETASSTSVSEAGTTDSFTVELTRQPTGTVTVSLTEALAGDEFNIDDTSLTFSTSTWNVPQPIVVTGLNDVDIDGDQTGRVDLAATGPGYTGTTNQVGISILDDDTATYTFSPTSVAVTEGGSTRTYTVVLDARPTSNVTVNLTTGGEVSVNPTSVVFSTSNWLTPRTITVTAVNDDLVDGTTGDTIVHTASSGDTDFSGIIDVVGANVTDNDEEGYDIDLGTALAVIEGGASDTYTIALTAEPLNDVIVTITPDGQTTVNPGVLTFTPANWDVAQTVTVTAVDDGVPEVNPHPGEIAHATASDDPIFDGMTATIIADVGDAGALLTTLEGPTKGAPGYESVFRAMLNAGGVGNVEYAWTAFRQGLNVGSGSGSTFRFTPADGGLHQIQVIVSDDNGQQPADFILFTSLGDSGTSVFVGDIVWLAEEGITRGCNPPANDLFCPNDIVTREQMAAFLVRFLDLNVIDDDAEFIDDDGSIFENDIERLATAGITRGCNPPTNDRFCPTDRVTREQMAAFLVRALGLTDDGGGNTFTDDNGSIFENDIAKLAAAGITRGCNPPANTQFCPTAFVTRGQMAAFLRRADAILNP